MCAQQLQSKCSQSSELRIETLRWVRVNGQHTRRAHTRGYATLAFNVLFARFSRGASVIEGFGARTDEKICTGSTVALNCCEGTGAAVDNDDTRVEGGYPEALCAVG